jgi:hypothetical protein
MKRTIVIIVGFILIADMVDVIAQTYNPKKAAEYARKWCKGRNTNPADADEWGGPYIDYSLPINGGKDCAAFVSQCLLYGGLDLSKGTNGNGAYVKPVDGVIAGAKELVEHLLKFQETDTLMIDVNNQHLWAELGDPAFLLNAHGDITTAYHSYICSEKDESGIGLFSAHTHDACGTTPRGDPQIHFHIKSSVPEHCKNCVQDEHLGETGIDCGGPCAPCQHAKSIVNYDYNTSSLPGTTRSFGAITAGNADVIVKSGQDVTFIAIGDVTLKPGFHAQSGSNFKVQKANTRNDVGADCGDFCEPLRKNYYCRDLGEYLHWYIANASSYKAWILQSCRNMNTIHYTSGTIETDGIVEFWDLRTGVSNGMGCNTNTFYLEIEIITCQGKLEKRKVSFYVSDKCSKSANDNETMYDVYNDSVDALIYNEYIIHPNPNTGSFTIQTNNFDNIKQIQVINPLGQIIYSIENPTDNTITLPNGAKGTYFVRIITETESITKKILVE